MLSRMPFSFLAESLVSAELTYDCYHRALLREESSWKVYKEAMERVDSQAVAYTTFCRLWQQLTPYLVLMKPMTDLCWECQKNSAAIQRAINHPECEKTAAVEAAMDHLELVQLERSYYKTKCDDCRRSILGHFTQDGHFQPPPLSSCTPPNSNPIEAHYSFDYAQQVSNAHAEHLKFYSSGINETLCTLPVFQFRSIIQAIHCNQGQSTFSLHSSVLSLELIVRLCRGKSTSSAMKLGLVAKEQTRLSASSITFLSTMD